MSGLHVSYTGLTPVVIFRYNSPAFNFPKGLKSVYSTVLIKIFVRNASEYWF